MWAADVPSTQAARLLASTCLQLLFACAGREQHIHEILQCPHKRSTTSYAARHQSGLNCGFATCSRSCARGSESADGAIAEAEARW